MSELNQVEQTLVLRMRDADRLIVNSGVSYIEYGYFGSVARGTYNSMSDLDIVMIVAEIPGKHKIALLRCDLECIGCDLAILLKSSFDNPETVFQKEVVKDYVKVRAHGEQLFVDCN